MLSIIIPTLNAAGVLAETLAVLSRARQQLPFEIIVADGGSTDDTALLAAQGGAMVRQVARGRGRQMAEATHVASGEWYLFLHADTRPQGDWAAAVAAFINNEDRNARRAGYFRFALDDRSRAACWLERIVSWRCRLLGLPYGDQGLLISKTYYHELGGFKAIPLMEDVELVRRIGRSRRKMLPATAITSAEKYRREGYFVRPLRNMICLGLYAAGVPPRLIASFYR
jgi:rSAM/selenodomain-associated transferase 2